MRRKYPTSTATRGTISCWTLVENSQLYARVPHPLYVAGSSARVGTRPPKFRLSTIAALAVGIEIQEIALRDVVAVDEIAVASFQGRFVVSAERRDRVGRGCGIAGVRVDDVSTDARLQGRLAVAEHVVRHAELAA